MRLYSALLGLSLLACSTGSQKATPVQPPTGEQPHGTASHGPHDGHHSHRFEKADDWTKRFDDPERAEWQKPDRVVELLSVQEGMSVVDLGAGTGYFMGTFSRAVGETGSVLALDIEADMIRYMEERAAREGLSNVSARIIESGDPGLAPGSADRIIIVNTWHHISDRTRYADALRRALAEGGSIAIIDYTKEAPHGPPAEHRLTAAEVVSELSSAGLIAAAIEEDLPLQYIVVAQRP